MGASGIDGAGGWVVISHLQRSWCGGVRVGTTVPGCALHRSQKQSRPLWGLAMAWIDGAIGLIVRE